VRTGKSGSLRDQPNELTESRNVLLAIISITLRLDILDRLTSQLNGEKSPEVGVHGHCTQGPCSGTEKKRYACRDYARWNADDLRRMMADLRVLASRWRLDQANKGR